MKLFLDSSVILSACNSSTGAARYICEQAGNHGWELLVAPYVETEVKWNLTGRPSHWQHYWQQLYPTLFFVEDILTFSFPVMFTTSKDKPILFSAYASVEVLLTLDAKDFAELLGGEFYGLAVRKPADFLMEQRRIGRI